MRYLSKRIDNNMNEDADRQVQQDTRDKQQDELMRMELLRMSREIASRASSNDIKALKKSLSAKVDSSPAGRETGDGFSPVSREALL